MYTTKKATVTRYKNKALKGDAKSQYIYGMFCYDGLAEGVPCDYVEAAEWFEKSAAQGYLDARTQLGKMLLLGMGVTEDRKRGKQLLNQAALNGSGQAFHILKYNR